MKKIAILEDNKNHFDTISAGAQLAKVPSEIVRIDDKGVVERIKEPDLLDIVPRDVDLFIIDVSLGSGHDEWGLEFCKRIKNEYHKSFDSIIISEWDSSEFQTSITIDRKNFINKNNYQGFELKIKVRNSINLIFQK